MPAFTLHVRNLFALREIRWSPEGACVLVGANGSGKTTLLLTLKALRFAFDRGLPAAVTNVFGGSHGLRNRDADEDEPVEIGIDLGSLSWRLKLTPRGPTVDYLADEVLRDGDEVVYSKDSLGNFVHGDFRPSSDQRLGLRALHDADRLKGSALDLVAFFRSITVFHDPDLWTLRSQGSRTTDNRHVHSRGVNAITMLRRWHQERPSRFKYDFVVNGLNAAFPGLVEDIDFSEAGQSLHAQFYAPGHELPTPLSSEANGVLAMLILLCELADGNEGGVVAIDEPENSLHPFAIRRFWSTASQWARIRKLTLLLATHSSSLLDELNGLPEQIHVLRTNQRPGPERLDELFDRGWLANFRNGELHVDGELGSNDEAP